MRQAGGLALACHLPPTLAVTAVLTAFAAAAGRGAGTVCVGAAVLAGQLSVGWCNDYVDRDRDRRSGRTDKPIVRGTVAAPVVGAAAVIALAACVPLSLASGWRAALAHLAGVAAAWAYDLGLKATPLSPVPYAVGFGLLPAFVVLGLPGHPAPPAWLVAAGVTLGVGAHFANVLPDLRADRQTGIVGLPHRIGATGSRATAGLLLVAASALLAAGPGRLDAVGVAGLAVVAVLLAAGVVVTRRPGSRAAFSVVLVVALLDAAMLIARGHGI